MLQVELLQVLLEREIMQASPHLPPSPQQWRQDQLQWPTLELAMAPLQQLGFLAGEQVLELVRVQAEQVQVKRGPGRPRKIVQQQQQQGRVVGGAYSGKGASFFREEGDMSPKLS